MAYRISIGINHAWVLVKPKRDYLSDVARPEVEPKTEIGRRLRAVRAAIGIEDRDMFAERTGISKSTIANYERGDRVPDASMLQRYRDVWDVDLNWLVTGDVGEMFLMPNHPLPPVVERFLDDRRRKPRRKVSSSTTRSEVDLSAERILSGQDNDFVYLPFFQDVRASAGPGALAVSEQNDSVIAFARSFLRDHGAVPDRCSIIRARGDSMAPTIPDASLLIVDHSQAEVANGCIMVVSVGDDLLVKRVRRRLDGQIDLISDNPAYPPETIQPAALQQLRVVGRVVYFCRTP